MLSLGRNPGEYLVIGDDVIIQVVSMEGDLRLSIEAPKDVKIVRGEVYEIDHPAPKCLVGKSGRRNKHVSPSVVSPC
jgi:carbon storage regulator